MRDKKSLMRKLYRQVADMAFHKEKDIIRLVKCLEKGQEPDGELDLRMVSEIRQTKDGVDIKLADRAKLIELLARLGEKLDGGGDDFLENLLMGKEGEEI